MLPSRISHFFWPSITKGYLFRLLGVGLTTYLLFGYLFIPLHIQGSSMEPTYHDGSFGFCWRLQYVMSPPERADVVAVRFSGTRVMLLKRVIAVEGETIEFRKGALYINGQRTPEPYVRFQSEWDLEPRKVAAGHVYVIGDNRGISMDRHQFGEVSVLRIVGGVL